MLDVINIEYPRSLADLLKMSESIELLSRYKVSIFEEYDKDALLQDVKDAESSL